jgi:hypothetical protein
LNGSKQIGLGRNVEGQKYKRTKIQDSRSEQCELKEAAKNMNPKA